MHLPTYHVYETESDYSEFLFMSIGPNGNIPKLILFELLFPDDNVYNLALVDIQDEGKLSDDNVSNNDDMRKVLATVVKVLIDYTSVFPGRKIYFQGSDEEGRRITLYQRAITQYYSILQENFYIEGYIDDKVKEPFNPLNDYQAFLVKRK